MKLYKFNIYLFTNFVFFSNNRVINPSKRNVYCCGGCLGSNVTTFLHYFFFCLTWDLGLTTKTTIMLMMMMMTTTSNKNLVNEQKERII